MRRWGVGLVLLSWLVLSSTLPVSAGIIYCKSDPVVTVGKTTLDLSIGIPLADQGYVTGPIAWKIQAPEGVDRDVWISDPGLNLKGHTFEFTDAGKVEDGTGTVRVKVSIPIDKERLKAGEPIPTELTVIALNGAKEVLAVGTHEGTSDMTLVKLEFRAEW
jgi:hypothetical protein